MRNKSLELSLYVAGAGAFGVFLRWLENQLAFTEEGLAEPSAFHWMLGAFLIICAIVFWRFLRQIEEKNYFVPESFVDALQSEVSLHRILRITAGALMVLGSLLLFAKSETDPFVVLLRVIAILAMLSGAAYPLILREAELGRYRPGLLCPLMLLPMLSYAAWLICSYRSNAINSVPLAYGLDMLVAILNMVACFRMAGFAFGAAQPWKALLAVMLSGTVSIMSLADERYLGMELILLAHAGMMLLYLWILLKNLQKRERQVIVKKDDGFEHL